MVEFILTNRKIYTPMEVVDLFSEHVRPENLEILIKHIAHPELAESVFSFAEIDGDIVLNLGNGENMIKITKKP